MPRSYHRAVLVPERHLDEIQRRLHELEQIEEDYR